jgi:hypothetical protein
MVSGALNALRQLGFAFGVAVFGALFQARLTDHGLRGGNAVTSGTGGAPELVRGAFASGVNAALVVAGILALVAGALVIAFVRRPGPSHDEETAPLQVVGAS